MSLSQDDDWDIFQDRIKATNAKEIKAHVSGSAVPVEEHETPHGRKPLTTANGNDNQSIYSTNTSRTTQNP